MMNQALPTYHCPVDVVKGMHIYLMPPNEHDIYAILGGIEEAQRHVSAGCQSEALSVLKEIHTIAVKHSCRGGRA